MEFYHSHNLVEPARAGSERRYGIRVTLPKNDTLTRILGDDWERMHWYESEGDRDRAFSNMATRHGYYRDTDTPTQILEKVSR